MALEIDFSIKDARNLSMLRRVVPSVEQIILSVPHVAIYKFEAKEMKWIRNNVEGACFLIQNITAPYHQLVVINKEAPEDFILDINTINKIKVQSPYLMIRHSTDHAPVIIGIWFHNDIDRDLLMKSIVAARATTNSTDNDADEHHSTTTTYPTVTSIEKQLIKTVASEQPSSSLSETLKSKLGITQNTTTRTTTTASSTILTTQIPPQFPTAPFPTDGDISTRLATSKPSSVKTIKPTKQLTDGGLTIKPVPPSKPTTDSNARTATGNGSGTKVSQPSSAVTLLKQALAIEARSTSSTPSKGNANTAPTTVKAPSSVPTPSPAPLVTKPEANKGGASSVPQVKARSIPVSQLFAPTPTAPIATPTAPVPVLVKATPTSNGITPAANAAVASKPTAPTPTPASLVIKKKEAETNTLKSLLLAPVPVTSAAPPSVVPPPPTSSSPRTDLLSYKSTSTMALDSPRQNYDPSAAIGNRKPVSLQSLTASATSLSSPPPLPTPTLPTVPHTPAASTVFPTTTTTTRPLVSTQAAPTPIAIPTSTGTVNTPVALGTLRSEPVSAPVALGTLRSEPMSAPVALGTLRSPSDLVSPSDLLARRRRTST